MATRRIGETSIDHGAQLITARSAVFATWVQTWQQLGWVAPWFDRGPAKGGWVYRGVPTMNALAKNLACGLAVHFSCRADSVSFEDERWTIVCQAGRRLTCRYLALTCPVPQALALIDSGRSAIAGAMRCEMDGVTFGKTITILATLEGDSAVPEPGYLDVGDCAVVRTICDGRRKGTSGATAAVTIHSTARFAELYYDAPNAVRVPLLLSAAKRYLGSPVTALSVHCWGYSEPSLRANSRFLYDPAIRLMVAGDGLGGGSIERAALSGLAAAERLLSANKV